jgi:hypothetical protein
MSLRIKNINLYCVCFVLVSCCSCTYKKAELKVECVLPETVSFNHDIQPIFNAHCNTAGCHSGGTPQGGLNLEATVAYAQLVNNGSGYIDTLNPTYSVLHASMNSTSSPMPPTGKLDKCTTDMVLKWIQQKAKNN